MFEKGDYVVYGTRGVCLIRDIAPVDLLVWTGTGFIILCARSRAEAEPFTFPLTARRRLSGV